MRLLVLLLAAAAALCQADDVPRVTWRKISPKSPDQPWPEVWRCDYKRVLPLVYRHVSKRLSFTHSFSCSPAKWLFQSFNIFALFLASSPALCIFSRALVLYFQALYHLKLALALYFHSSHTFVV